MFDHIRDTLEDVAVGAVVTIEMFKNFEKGWITFVLGAIYICYKIYTQHLKAKTEKLEQEKIKQQLDAWVETKDKVEESLKKQIERRV